MPRHVGQQSSFGLLCSLDAGRAQSMPALDGEAHNQLTQYNSISQPLSPHAVARGAGDKSGCLTQNLAAYSWENLTQCSGVNGPQSVAAVHQSLPDLLAPFCLQDI
eukprot:1145343-Pelagomonas_calceolata.AAC.2